MEIWHFCSKICSNWSPLSWYGNFNFSDSRISFHSIIRYFHTGTWSCRFWWSHGQLDRFFTQGPCDFIVQPQRSDRVRSTVDILQLWFGPKAPFLRIFLLANSIRSVLMHSFTLQYLKMKINIINIITTSSIMITLSRAFVVPPVEAHYPGLEKRQICPCTTGRGGPPSPYCCPNYQPPTGPPPGECPCMHGTPSARCCPGYTPPSDPPTYHCPCVHGGPSPSCCWWSCKVPSAKFLKVAMEWIEADI